MAKKNRLNPVIATEPKSPLSDQEAEGYRLVYEQTVLTLRNWDSLFATAVTSTLVVGGIGSMATILSKSIDSGQAKAGAAVVSNPDGVPPTLRMVLTSVAFVFGFLVLVYAAYNFSVARSKKALLGEIEKKLGVEEGAYIKTGKKGSRVLYWMAAGFIVVLTVGILSLWRTR